jgi:hypothetical protein
VIEGETVVETGATEEVDGLTSVEDAGEVIEGETVVETGATEEVDGLTSVGDG